MKKLKTNNNLFESIKHIDENGKGYWCARELQKALDYKEWRKFNGVINKAVNACKASNVSEIEHFVGADKPIRGGNGNVQKVLDYKLSRYACYLMHKMMKYKKIIKN